MSREVEHEPGTSGGPSESDLAAADAIITRWTLWAAGLGLVPLPLVDFATTTTFSMKVVADLAARFGVQFDKRAGRAAVVSLIGGAAAPVAGAGLVSLLKGLPIVGLPLAVMTGPVTCGGVVYGVGRIFAGHFAAGGTLADFDAEAVREAFKGQVEDGKAFVKRRRAKAKGDDASAGAAASTPADG